jgi:hypothetical protein
VITGCACAVPGVPSAGSATSNQLTVATACDWRGLGTSFLFPGGRQGAPKKKKEKSDVPIYLPFLRFFEIFRSDFRKHFYGAFGLLIQRNGQKRYKKIFDGKRRKEKSFFPQLFRPKAFDMDFSQKVFHGVFELPLMRNAQKRHKKRS